MRLQLKIEKERRLAAERGLRRAENRYRGLMAIYKSTKPLHADEIKANQRMLPAKASDVRPVQRVPDPQSGGFIVHHGARCRPGP